MPINFLIKIIKAINANQRPGEMAAAIAIAWHLALMPSGSGLWWVLFLFSMFLRINFAIQAVFLAIFNLFTYLLDPWIHSVGYALLTSDALKDFWLTLWNTPPFGALGINNTLITGGFVLGFVFWIPIYVISVKLIQLYREKLHKFIAEHPLTKAFFQLPLIKNIAEAYQKASAISNHL